MTASSSPFYDIKYGWTLGEDGWNVGMDENLLKFSATLDSNITAFTATTPVLATGDKYINTTDKKLYFNVSGTIYSFKAPVNITYYVAGSPFFWDGNTATPGSGGDAIQRSEAGTTGLSVLAANTPATGRTALGLGTASTQPTGAFEPAIAAGTASQYITGTRTLVDFGTSTRGSVLTGLSVANSTVVAATDTLLVGVGKLQAQVTLRAPLASPALTGTPTAPTAAAGTNTTQLATTAFVRTEVAGASGTTNLSNTPAANSVTINSSSGTGTSVPAATTSLAGVMAGSDKAKLDGITAGAQTNQNAFSSVSVAGQSDVVADTPTDTLTLVAGSNITLTTDAATDTITINSTGGGGSGGLVNFTEAINSAAPNIDVPVVSLTVNNAATSVDLAVVPKGNGAFFLSVPDNGTSGGNKRGVSSVDLQRVRSASNQVAGGNFCSLLGGSGNRMSETASHYSTIAGGSSSYVSAQYCAVGGGLSNTVSQVYGAISGGRSNTVGGQYGFIGGGMSNTVATGFYSSVLGGTLNTCNADYSTILGGGNNTVGSVSYYSTILGGEWGNTRNVNYVEVRANGRFSVAGDAQRSRVTLRVQTGDATSTSITTSGTAPFTNNGTNFFQLPDNSTYAYTATLVARSSTGVSSIWKITGGVKRGAGGTGVAVVALVGTPTVTLVAQDSGAASWGVGVSASTPLGGILFSVTGVASTSIKWVADVETVEVVG